MKPKPNKATNYQNERKLLGFNPPLEEKDELQEGEKDLFSATCVIGGIVGCGLILMFLGCRPALGV